MLLHLHLPHVSLDLTLLERLVLQDLLAALFSSDHTPDKDKSKGKGEEEGGGILVSSGVALLTLHDVAPSTGTEGDDKPQQATSIATVFQGTT